MSDVLSMWTVYNHPSDHPDHWVARRWEILASGPSPTDDKLLAGSVEDVRAMLPEGLFRLDRQEEDDPVIFETWL